MADSFESANKDKSHTAFIIQNTKMQNDGTNSQDTPGSIK